MNKNIILSLLTGIIISSSCVAQKPLQPNISQSDVSRVLKTLSADDMMGRDAMKPEEIGKAADFIANEFKFAGLEYFEGLKTYRQSFDMKSIKPSGGSLLINGKSISKENYAVSSTAESVDLNALPKILFIKGDDNFNTKYREALNSNEDALVVVEEKFKATFTRFKGFLERGSMSFEIKKSPNLIFLLSNETPQTIALSHKNTISSLPMFNVLGVLPGKSKPNEYVVFSGHYDHIGILKAKNQDSIANGADDDASGTTAVIQLAKHFAKEKNNERTLIFVAFTAEEIGGYGSQYFSKQLNPEQTIAMFNIEMIGKESKFGLNNAFITGYERSDFGKILQNNLVGTSFKFYPDPYPKENLFYRSDNATLARLGVPAHTISSDQIDTDKLYHSVDDEYESMNIGNITEIIKAIAISSKSIISGNDTPTRITGVK
jgi:hypothetical protein